MRSIRKYRAELMKAFWVEKTKITTLVFITLIMFSALVQTKKRLLQMARVIVDEALRGVVTAILIVSSSWVHMWAPNPP